MRGDHRQVRPALQQGRGAADVIVVVVGQQHRDRRHAAIGRCQYRARVARVDDEGAATVDGQRPDVIVFERGQGLQLHHGTLQDSLGTGFLAQNRYLTR